MKPYAAACDENRDPILSVIQPLLVDKTSVLEIGSGTGQHAIYFGAHLTHLSWQTSDQAEYHEGIQAWLSDANVANVKPPLLLDVTQTEWPNAYYDAIFTANTLHIMGWPAVEACFEGVGRLLPVGGLFIAYGPFNYKGNFTSDSNARFDRWLKQRDPVSGIRDFEAVNQLAISNSLQLQQDYAMPVNNRTLVWQKTI